MKLFRTKKGHMLEHEDHYYQMGSNWEELINRDHLYTYLFNWIKSNRPMEAVSKENLKLGILVPIGKQEVWAAGVTYMRSKEARMEESKDSGGADFYQKVYEAERPELFFKALPHRVAAHKEKVYIRKDSKWNVPEPELTLYINSGGNIQGYTIGNDMSSRDIEGENPLYLPQAKVYERSAALGPCLYVPEFPISKETMIQIIIKRNQQDIFQGKISLNRMKRDMQELASYLFRECVFEHGCFLMTGTGIVPPADFTLQDDDEIMISIEGIGTLINTVSHNSSLKNW